MLLQPPVYTSVLGRSVTVAREQRRVEGVVCALGGRAAPRRGLSVEQEAESNSESRTWPSKLWAG